MGVEYVRYLLPQDRTYRPTKVNIVKCIYELFVGKYLIHPQHERLAEMDFGSGSAQNEKAKESGCYRQTDAGVVAFSFPVQQAWAEEAYDDEQLVWPITTPPAGLIKPPLLFAEGSVPEEYRYYEVKFRLGKDFLHEMSEIIDPLSSTCCKCGEDLKYYGDAPRPVYFSARIKRTCGKCGATFDPGLHSSLVRNPFGEGEQEVPGGCVSCFSIAIDCGKCFHEDPATIATDPEFKRICETALRSPLVEIDDLY